METLKEMWKNERPVAYFFIGSFSLLALLILCWIFSEGEHQGKCYTRSGIPGIVYNQDNYGVSILFKGGENHYRSFKVLSRDYEEISCNVMNDYKKVELE